MAWSRKVHIFGSLRLLIENIKSQQPGTSQDLLRRVLIVLRHEYGEKMVENSVTDI